MPLRRHTVQRALFWVRRRELCSHFSHVHHSNSSLLFGFAAAASFFFFFNDTIHACRPPPPCFDLFIHACSCEDVSKWICVSIYQDACRSPRACVCVCFPYPPLERLGEWRWRPCVARRAGWGQSSPDAPSDSGHHSLTSPWGGTGRQREQFLGDGPCACVFMSLVAVCLCVRSCVYVCVYVSECEAEISLQYVPCQHW